MGIYDAHSLNWILILNQFLIRNILAMSTGVKDTELAKFLEEKFAAKKEECEEREKKMGPDLFGVKNVFVHTGDFLEMRKEMIGNSL